METAGDIIKDALQEIAVHGAELSLNPADAQSGIRYLNRMMASFDASGISLGYTEVNSLGDVVTVPAGAISGMVSQLAINLFAQYSQGEPIPADLIARSIRDKDAMRALSVRIIPTQYPSTLPRGSGNHDNTGYDYNFYPEPKEKILTESTGAIATEQST